MNTITAEVITATAIARKSELVYKVHHELVDKAMDAALAAAEKSLFRPTAKDMPRAVRRWFRRHQHAAHCFVPNGIKEYFSWRNENPGEGGVGTYDKGTIWSRDGWIYENASMPASGGGHKLVRIEGGWESVPYNYNFSGLRAPGKKLWYVCDDDKIRMDALERVQFPTCGYNDEEHQRWKDRKVAKRA